MSIDSLIQRIQSEMAELELHNLSPETEFEHIERWNSLYTLVLTAMVSRDYNVDLSGADVRRIKTIQDLYNVITSA